MISKGIFLPSGCQIKIAETNVIKELSYNGITVPSEWEHFVLTYQHETGKFWNIPQLNSCRFVRETFNDKNIQSLPYFGWLIRVSLLITLRGHNISGHSEGEPLALLVIMRHSSFCIVIGSNLAFGMGWGEKPIIFM